MSGCPFRRMSVADWQNICATPGLRTPWAGPYSSGILRPIMHLGLPV